MKYNKNGQINLNELKHDVAGLHGPLSYAKELLETGEKDLSLKIQSDLLKKIDLIVQEIEKIGSANTGVNL